jgi:hypothetical protein
LSEPRVVTVTLPGIKSLTILEIARASAISHVKRADTERLLRTMLDPTADPSELELGATLLYAWAWQLVKRDEPGVTWDEAQTWRVEFDLDVTDSSDDEARAVVEVAIATGLSPREAATLTVAEVAAYAEFAEIRSR